MTKAQFRILVVLTVVFGFLGGAACNLLSRGAPAIAAGTAAPVQSVVAAEKFVLVDKNGNWRGELGFSPEGDPGLTLGDETGRARVAVCVTKSEGPKVALFDAGGNQRIVLGSIGLSISDSALKMGPVNEYTSVSTITLFDEAGKIFWEAPDMGLSGQGQPPKWEEHEAAHSEVP